MSRRSNPSSKRDSGRWARSLWSNDAPDRGAKRGARSAAKARGRRAAIHARRGRFESLESRCLFNVDPIWVGGVYVEEDGGSDAHGDSFYITFKGGAADTKLTRLVIKTDQGAPGFSQGDNLFDTVEGGRGADHAFPFRVVSLESRDPNAKVTAKVDDGAMAIVLDFENFFAGDRLHFSVDVDEVQHLYGLNDLAKFNEGLDPITSGAEFEGSSLEADFIAPNFENASASGTFANRYDGAIAPSGLNLPADNENGLRDRTAGAATSVVQRPKPIALAGSVFVDTNENVTRDAGESGIAGVQLELFRRVGNDYVSTGNSTVTDANGRYEFGIDLGLQPGTYQIREIQPDGYLSVGAAPGRREVTGGVGTGLNGAVLGEAVASDLNVLTAIAMPDGGQRGIELNFAEVQPVQVHGIVFQDRNDDGIQQSGETGIEGVEIRIASLQTSTGKTISRTTRTGRDGSYQFLALPPGTYSISEVQPVEYFDGKDSVGKVGDQLRGAASVNDVLTSIQLRSGERGTQYNFAEIPPASIAGQVEIGLPGYPCFTTDPAGKQPLAGVNLSLVNSKGETVATAITQADGSYRFDRLPIGLYAVIESQPQDLIDGGSRAGTVDGKTVGNAVSGTRIESIELWGGDEAQNYDFCERLPSSLSGNVYADLNEDGDRDPSDPAIAGVALELLNDRNEVIATVTSDAQGHYRFTGLRPGTYTVREQQPMGYFQGGQSAGSLGGDASGRDRIQAIAVRDGQAGIDYDFREVPPTSIAGRVFQDGDALVTPDGQPPASLVGIRDGWYTSEDLPISGVQLELRRADGSPLSEDDVLPGVSVAGGVRTTTDAAGRYAFTGIRPGSYQVIESQPAGYFDGIDHAGSTGGVAVNGGAGLSAIDAALVDYLENTGVRQARRDAIVRIRATAVEGSIDNNFSEVLVERAPEPPLPPVIPVTPVPLPVAVPASFKPFDPELRVANGLHLAPAPFVPLIDNPPAQAIAGYPVDFTWHLSIVNAGEPRGYQNRKAIDRGLVARSSRLLNFAQWTIDTMYPGRWYIVTGHRNPPQSLSREAFGIAGAIQLAGDFNGDGRDEVALFKDGEWLLDINGNGRWDRSDLWAKLGAEGDLPVVGDWDGDGKDDIGVWGLERSGDMAAIEREPGLPDPGNRHLTKPKNLPPRDEAEELMRRWMQRSATGEPRSDVVDHVFRFGDQGDQPIAGDFNGDGVSSLGIFRNGIWRLDVNGDGQFDTSHDTMAEFGRAGDIAIVGDFNGDGLDEIAVVRGNQLIVDSNGNGRMDATDRVFEMAGEGDGVVVGDFDGDGVDEAAFYTIERSREADPIRQAKAG